MGAAGLQQPGDLLLVAGAVELEFHRVRRCSHLTQRQRGGEDFDEERFHWWAVAATEFTSQALMA